MKTTEELLKEIKELNKKQAKADKLILEDERGKEIYNYALLNLLIKKKVFTKKELEEMIKIVTPLYKAEEKKQVKKLEKEFGL